MKNLIVKNKVFILAALFAISAFGFFLLLNKKGGEPVSLKQEKVKIAACPTCFEMIDGLDNEKYEVVKTASTSESIALLKGQKVDVILAGRVLKPGEPQMDYISVGEGYSFLSGREEIVYLSQLNNYDLYTDLDAEKLKNIFPIENISQVDNVYQYLDKGIVITSWENTDYNKAAVVHVLEASGERVKLSRRPTFYCSVACGEDIQELVSLLK